VGGYFRKISRAVVALSPSSCSRRYARQWNKATSLQNILAVGTDVPEALVDSLLTRPEYTDCRVRRNVDDPRTLATARCIVTGSPLPPWFAVRMDQTLILCAPGGYDEFSLSALLAADEIVADAEEAAKLQTRLGPIFTGRILQKRSLIPFPTSEIVKRRLLIYGGSLGMNGVTTSLLYRLHSLDYTRYDVTFVVPEKPLSTVETVLQQLPDPVRVLPPMGHFSATLFEQLLWLWLSRRGEDPNNPRFEPLNAMFRREARRRYGNAAFDAVIDYSGYGGFYPMLFLQTSAGRRMIWQHNDIHRDLTNKEKSGQRRYRYFHTGLSIVTKLYGQFDRVVSASKAVWEENQRNFALPGRERTFVWCDNLIDAVTVREKAAKDNTFTVNGRDYYQDTRTDVTNETALLSAPLPERNGFHFVTVGRLSPEKNHDSLIRAFAILAKEVAHVGLTIIGNGEQETALKALVAELGVTDKVWFTGNLQNPFAYVKHFDAFAFVSHYEAMGLVVIEARILGLPILLSDYSAASSVMVPGGQILTKQDPDSICEGMRRLMAAPQLAYAPFDEEAWRETTSQQFEALFD